MYEVTPFVRDNRRCPYNDLREVVKGSGNKKGLGIIDAVVQALRENGLDLLDTNMMDHIEDQIFELRPGGYRVLCFYDQAVETFVLLNGFRKETRRTPESEKEEARMLVIEYRARQRG